MAQWIQNAALDPTFATNLYPQTAWPSDPATALEPGEVTLAAERLRRSGVAVPLLVTRSHLVHLGDLVGLRLVYDGTLRLHRAGWVASDGTEP
jgi:hypothetical protein